MHMLTDCLSQNIKLKYGRMNLAVKQFFFVLSEIQMSACGTVI